MKTFIAIAGISYFRVFQSYTHRIGLCNSSSLSTSIFRYKDKEKKSANKNLLSLPFFSQCFSLLCREYLLVGKCMKF